MVRGGRDEGVSNKKYLINYKNIFSKENIFTSRHPLDSKSSTNEREDDDWCIQKANQKYNFFHFHNSNNNYKQL